MSTSTLEEIDLSHLEFTPTVCEWIDNATGKGCDELATYACLCIKCEKTILIMCTEHTEAVQAFPRRRWYFDCHKAMGLTRTTIRFSRLGEPSSPPTPS